MNRQDQREYTRMKNRINRQLTARRMTSASNKALLSQQVVRTDQLTGLVSQALPAHQMIYGLRGLWPMNSVLETCAIPDMSLQGRTLSASGTVDLRCDGMATYAGFNTSYLYRGDEAGLEYAGSMAFGGWFYFNTIPAGGCNFYGKFGTAGNYGYTLQVGASGHFACYFSGDGTALAGGGTGVDVETGRWYFVAGRFSASTSVNLYVDAERYEFTSSIPAAIHNNSAQLQIGANSALGQYMDGRASFCWVAAGGREDYAIEYLYEASRGLFGV